MMEEQDKRRDEIFSKAVKAGKRTYFFDVKTTRGSDLYITLTESKKRFEKDTNKFSYEKHKIFLYKEDFEKFVEGLNETIVKINELKESGFVAEPQENHYSQTNYNHTPQETMVTEKQYSSVEFEDLDK
jgi:hypothetical protein